MRTRHTEQTTARSPSNQRLHRSNTYPRGLVGLVAITLLVPSLLAMAGAPIAQTEEPTKCKASSVLDIQLVLDDSGSMSGQKLDITKEGSKRLVQNLTSSDQSGVVWYDSFARLTSPLDFDHDDSIAGIQAGNAGGGTNGERGIRLGHDQIQNNGRDSSRQVMIHLTDGFSGGDPVGAANDVKADDVEFFAIGVGPSVNTQSLQDQASDPNDPDNPADQYFYHVQQVSDVVAVFEEITENLVSSGTHAEAYGLQASVDGAQQVPQGSNAELTVNKLNQVIHPPGGEDHMGNQSVNASEATNGTVPVNETSVDVRTFNVGPVDVSLNTVHTVAEGNSTDAYARAHARTIVEGLEITDASTGQLVLSADVLRAESTSNATPEQATSRDDTTRFAGLTVAGASTPQVVPPNTNVTIPGVGELVLNEQFDPAEAPETGSYSGLRVNLVHLTIENETHFDQSAEIIVSSAFSAASCGVSEPVVEPAQPAPDESVEASGPPEIELPGPTEACQTALDPSVCAGDVSAPENATNPDTTCRQYLADDLCDAAQSPSALRDEAVDRGSSVLCEGTGVSLVGGCEQWSDRFDANGDFDTTRDTTTGPDGEVLYVTGLTRASDNDATTIAYNVSNGKQLWNSTFDGGGFETVGGIATSPDGSTVFVAGSLDANGGDDYLTIAYNASTGAEKWTATRDGPHSGNDVVRDVAVNPDGSTVYVTGTLVDFITIQRCGFFSCFTDEVPHNDYGTIAYNASTGAEEWSAQFNRDQVSRTSQDDAINVDVSADGTSVVVTGETQGNRDDIGTLAYDAADGTQQWTQFFDGPQQYFDRPTDLEIGPNGEFAYVTGWTGADAIPGTFGSQITYDYVTLNYRVMNGAEVWHSLHDGGDEEHDFARGLAVSPDGSAVYVTGENRGGPNGTDVGTVAYNATNGNATWTDRRDGGHAGFDRGVDVDTGPEGERIYVAGTAQGPHNRDILTLAYDDEGDEWFSQRYDGANQTDLASSVATGAADIGHTVLVSGTSLGQQTSGDMATVAYDSGLATELPQPLRDLLDTDPTE